MAQSFLCQFLPTWRMIQINGVRLTLFDFLKSVLFHGSIIFTSCELKGNDLLSLFWDENCKVLHWILYSQTWVSVSAFSLTGYTLSWTHYFYLFVCLFWSHTACRILVPQPNIMTCFMVIICSNAVFVLAWWSQAQTHDISEMFLYLLSLCFQFVCIYIS